VTDEFGNPKWIDIARSFVLSLGVATTDDALQSVAPNATYRVLGHHSLSGEFSGRDAIAKHLVAIVTQTDGRFDPVKFVDWMIGLRHVSVLVDVHVQVGHAAQLLRHLILMAFNAEDLIEEVIVFTSDPDVAERLYGHLLREAQG
jgi:hypothetical protein